MADTNLLCGQLFDVGNTIDANFSGALSFNTAVVSGARLQLALVNESINFLWGQPAHARQHVFL